MTLKEALDTIAKYCQNTRCEVCPLYYEPHKSYGECNLQRESPEDYDKITIVETNMYDKEEIHKNCTVQILKNSVTGETSIGWWQDDSSNDLGAGRT